MTVGENKTCVGSELALFLVFLMLIAFNNLDYIVLMTICSIFLLSFMFLGLIA